MITATLPTSTAAPAAPASAEAPPAEPRTHFLTVEETPRVKRLRREWRKAAPFAAPLPAVMYPAPGAGRWRYAAERREAKWDAQGRYRPVTIPARREWLPDARTPQLRIRIEPEPGTDYHVTPGSLGLSEDAARLIRPGDSVCLDFTPAAPARPKMPLHQDSRCNRGVVRVGDAYTDGAAISVGANAWGVEASDCPADDPLTTQVPALLERAADAETVESAKTYRHDGNPRGRIVYRLSTATRAAEYSGAYVNGLLKAHKADSLRMALNGQLFFMRGGAPVAALSARGDWEGNVTLGMPEDYRSPMPGTYRRRFPLQPQYIS